jgi:hypothetical protein
MPERSLAAECIHLIRDRLSRNTKPCYKSKSDAVKFSRFIKAKALQRRFPPNCTSATSERAPNRIPSLTGCKCCRDVVGRAGCWKRLDHSSEVGRRPATNSAKLPAIRDTFPAVST